ncbi:MAG: hypothetical protein ACRDP7_45015 [Trebonia sp.]
MGAGWPTKLTTVVMLLLPTAFVALGSPVALLTNDGYVQVFEQGDVYVYRRGNPGRAR